MNKSDEVERNYSGMVQVWIAGPLTCKFLSINIVPVFSFYSFSFLLKYRWYTMLCFCCTAKWFSYTYIYILFHYRLLQDIEYNSLFCTVREGNGTPLQYSCLENPMDGGAWWAAVHGVAKSQTRLRGFTFTFHFHALEKEMATHSSVLAWRIPGTGEPGGIAQSRTWLKRLSSSSSTVESCGLFLLYIVVCIY